MKCVDCIVGFWYTLTKLYHGTLISEKQLESINESGLERVDFFLFCPRCGEKINDTTRN